MPDTAPGFFKTINDDEAGQLLSFAANFSGVFSAAIQGVTAFLSAFLGTESDTDKILGAIDQLSQQLDLDFRQLGGLITQQTQLATETTNRDAMATALSHSDAGNFQLQGYAGSKNLDAMTAAETESVVGLEFFLELDESPPNPFFLPGLVKAGAIRVFVIAAQTPAARAAGDVAQLQQMTDLLSQMIDVVISTTEAAHVVQDTYVTVAVSGNPHVHGPITMPAYEHLDRGGRIALFAADTIPHDPLSPPGNTTPAQALAMAQKNRDDGVTAELNFLAVPQFQGVLNSWKALVG